MYLVINVTKEVEKSGAFKALMMVLEHFRSIDHTDWYGDEGVQVTDWISDDGYKIASQTVWVDGTIVMKLTDKYSIE